MDMTPVMRFQVANDSINLVKNPNGDRGAFFYTTPVTNTLLTAASGALTFKTTVGQASYFLVNKMPIAAGQYASSRLDIQTITASHNVKIQYEWLDINDTLLSTSTLSGALSTIGTNIGPTSLAPANTAWFKMKIWLENGSTAASANASVTFNKVMAKVTPTGSATSQRTNIINNPSFEVNTDGWLEDNDSTTLGRTTTKAYVGTAAGTLRRDGSAGWTTARTVSYSVTAKKTYTASAYVSEHTGGVGDAVIAIQWMTASNKVISLSAGTKVNPGSGWSRITVTATAPGNAYYAQVIIKNYSGTGNIMAFDAVLFEQAGTVGDYFDGTTTDTSQIVYDWTGTAHSSRSTATSTSTFFDYVDPYDWRDILGTTSDMKIDRGGLETGTLTATLIDSTLDPVDSEVLAEGKTVRLQMQKEDGSWKNRFEGQIDSLRVSYPVNLKGYAEVKTKTVIELVAIDNVSNLAGHKYTDANGKSIGVSVAHIPGTIEGANVPWLVNGSNAQVTSIAKLSVSDDASALDQIAIARDSERGYAWVDVDNVLNVVDSANVDNTVKATLTDTSIVNGIFDGTAWATTGWGVYNIYDYNAGASFSLQTGSGLDAYDTFYRVTSAASDDLGFRLTPNPEMVPAIEGDMFVLNGWVRYTNNTNNNGLSIYATQKVNTDVSPTESGPIVLQDGVWQQIRIQLPTVTGASAASVESFLFAYLVNGGDYIDLTGFYVEQIGNPIPSYGDITVTASTDDIVNSVTVNKLSNNANNTQPTAYTYKDADSIAKYGEITGEFPYQGSSAGIATFAQSILDARAWPVRRVESLVMPVNDSTWDYACDLDLYDVIHVKYGEIIDSDHRITSISETFTVEADRHRWEVTYGFDTVSGVATPRETGGTGKTHTKSSIGAVMQNSGTALPNGTTTSLVWNQIPASNAEMTIGNSGITVLQDGLYRITGQVALNNVGTTGFIQVNVRVNGSTVRVIFRGPFNATAPTIVGGGCVLNLTAGNEVTLAVFQNNGASRNLDTGDTNATTMEVQPL